MSFPIVVPTRGRIPAEVLAAWKALSFPVGEQPRFIFITGHEVAEAYERGFESAMRHKSNFILTMEDDNIPPPDAVFRLMQTIGRGLYSAVSGLYFTKGDGGHPLVFGDPEEYDETGDFRPAPRPPEVVAAHVELGDPIPVLAIPMGCALWRWDLFEAMPRPWFKTGLAQRAAGQHVVYSQDIYFCEKAVGGRARFAVDPRVRVGHLDVESGKVY